MLRAARQRRGLGLRELARSAGISKSHIFNLEAGCSCPSRSLALRLVEVLELTSTEQERLLAGAVDDAGRDHPARNQALQVSP